jgi:hypothetical protein
MASGVWYEAGQICPISIFYSVFTVQLLDQPVGKTPLSTARIIKCFISASLHCMAGVLLFTYHSKAPSHFQPQERSKAIQSKTELVEKLILLLHVVM